MGSNDYLDLGVGRSKHPPTDFHIMRLDNLALAPERCKVQFISS